MKKFLVLAVALLMAGCLGSEDGTGTESSKPEPRLEMAESGFYSGVTYDAASFDIADLSQPDYTILQEELWITSSDGQRMHNIVFRPDADGTFPVFINFSPYWGNTAELGGDNFAKYMVDNFVPRGYVVVLSALRGTGHSEGCFEIGSDREIEDLYDVIDHFATATYSNGNIAAGGKSYDSTTQNGLIAKMPHPALKGLFHVSGITDMYRYNIKDGVPSVNGLAFTPRYYATQTFDEVVAGNGATLLDQEVLLRTVDDVACPEAAEHVVHGEAAAATGIKSDYWQEREWTEFIGDSSWNGSIFFVHGFQDWNVKPDNILPWLSNLPEDIHVLAWLHQDKENGGHLYPMRTDWNLTMLRWMDENLKGIDAGIGRTDYYELEGDDGLWRETDYLAEAMDFDISGATVDTNATRLTGKVTISGTVTPQSPDAIFVATLYALNGDDRTWAGEAVARLIYQDGLYAPSPIVPGLPIDVTVEFYPLDTVGLDGFEVDFGGTSQYSVVASSAVAYDGPFMLHATPAPLDELTQPISMPCIAC